MNDKATKTLQLVLLLASAAGIVVSILNVYLYAKQAPLTERIAIIEQVQADNSESSKTGFQHVSNEFERLNKRLDSMDTKLDKALGF